MPLGVVSSDNEHMKKYLLFDADGTLYDFAASARISLEKVFTKNGIAYTKENFELYESGNKWCWECYEKGTLTQEELKTKRFQLLFDKLKLHQSALISGEDYVENLSRAGIMIPGAVDFLEHIKDRDMSIITNGIAKTQHGRIDRTNTGKYFQHLFISQEMGLQKPDKAFFDEVLSVIGRKPEECLVIGDSDKSDIQGAINAGIDSVWINFDGKKSERATYSVSSYKELEELLERL
mgnify:CR=1 FL=1